MDEGFMKGGFPPMNIGWDDESKNERYSKDFSGGGGASLGDNWGNHYYGTDAIKESKKSTETNGKGGSDGWIKWAIVAIAGYIFLDKMGGK